MHVAIRILSVVGRGTEFLAAVICAGILGRYIYVLDLTDINPSSKIEYALAISGIAIAFSLLFIPPFAYQFWAFPFDLCMFVMWMVSFGLLDNLSPGCSSPWYVVNWRFTWSGSHCGKWRAVQAWMFIGAMAWLGNACLGLYYVVSRTTKKEKERGEELSRGSHEPKSQAQNHSIP